MRSQNVMCRSFFFLIGVTVLGTARLMLPRLFMVLLTALSMMKRLVFGVFRVTPKLIWRCNSGQYELMLEAHLFLTIILSGQVYPLHPLDVVPTSVSDVKSCVGSFIPQSISVGGGELLVIHYVPAYFLY